MEFFPGAFEREWERRHAMLMHEMQLGQSERATGMSREGEGWRGSAMRGWVVLAGRGGDRAEAERGGRVAVRERSPARCKHALGPWRAAVSLRWSSWPPMAAAHVPAR